MQQLALSTSNLETMGTREIAGIIHKQHSKVLAKVKELVSEGIAKSATPIARKNPQNKQNYSEFILNKRDSIVLVATMSPRFTAQIVDRWQELEAQVSAPQPLPSPETPKLDLDAAKSFVAQVKHFTEMQKQVDEFNQIKGSLTEMLGVQVAKPQQKFSYEQVKARLASNVNDAKIKGVVLNKRDNKWQVRFNHKGEFIYLGLFKTLDEAVRVRVNAEIDRLEGREITRQH